MANTEDSSRQNEAITLLGEALYKLASSDKDIKSTLRKCQLACELLGWDQQKKWFHQELNGYSKDSTLPDYRKITGIRKWEISGTLSDRLTWASEELVVGVDPKIYVVEPDILEVWAGIEWIAGASTTGYKEILSETKIVQTPKTQKFVTLQRVRDFTASAINASLSQIEKNIYDFVSSAYVQLKYSNVIKSIWTDYHAQVEIGLLKVGMTQHLSIIENNLLSDNSEAWRVAALECRNLLNDLANYLWRDTRKRYEHLEGKTVDRKLDVAQGKYGNRLAAYLHQKGITGTQGKFLRDEVERLATSIHSLISYQSEAHEPINLQNARSVAISTYIIIGEIITRTDLAPIDVYGEPAIKDIES